MVYNKVMNNVNITRLYTPEGQPIVPPPITDWRTGERKFTLYLTEEFYDFIERLAKANYRNRNQQLVLMLFEATSHYLEQHDEEPA